MKRGFTLIELLASIAIFGLILIFLYSALENLDFSNKFYERKKSEFDEKEKTISLLYSDISEAQKVNIINPIDRKFSILLIENTPNSLNGPSKANVLWYVNSINFSLMRLESYDTISQDGIIKPDQIFLANEVAPKNESFYVIKKNDGIFIYSKFENQEKEVFFINAPNN